ncbi:hypothetical protein ACF0H5_013310 [Mactra antiquata]
MSHHTAKSSVFPKSTEQNLTPRRKKMLQEYTAIQVADPRRYDLPTPPTSEEPQPKVRNSPVQNHTVIERSDPRIDDLVARQDQLMDHQKQVSARQEEIANHLKNQSNAMNQALLQQVLRNKDNMIESLAQQQGIMAELKGRDIAVMGTNKAVNKLEVHHVTVLHDLRGRIVRCDTAINKHTKDIMMLMDEIRRLEGLIYAIQDKLKSDIHRLEAEVISMTSELERQNSEQRSELNRLRGDTNHRLDMMEDRQKANMLELKDALQDNKTNLEHHMERMEAKFKAMIDKATGGWQDMMGQIDQQIQNHLMSITSRMNKLEDKQAVDKHKLGEIQRGIENQVMATLQETLNYNNAELARAKMEFRNGFTELQESMSNMKHVVEGRRKLLGNQMSKEIGQVKKALYMEMPGHQPIGTTVIFKNKEKSDGW